VEERIASYTLVTDVPGLARAAEALKESEAVGVDVETTALSPRDGRIRLLQLATPDETFVVDLFEAEDLSPLKEVFEDGPVKVLHNSKFDYSFLHALHGISLSPIFDTMLAAQLLAGGDQSPSFSLEAVTERYTDQTLDKSEQRSDWSGSLSQGPDRVCSPRRCHLAAATREARRGVGRREARHRLEDRVSGGGGDRRDGARGDKAGRRAMEGAREDGP
jgi:DNA polymerase I-like protein with 3'-5' exonuclease and polymerase domains